MLGFSFEPRLAFDEEIYRIIKSVCDVSFSDRLIQINLPKSLARDYLANVVLYHELGHFIDLRFQLSSALSTDLLQGLVSQKLNSSEIGDLQKYFPYISDLSSQKYSDQYIRQIYNLLKVHLAEYFCDLFASQYIGDCSGHYLKYLTGRNNASLSHPSTESRNDIVNQFLRNNSESFVLEKIRNTVFKVTGKEIRIKYEAFDSDDFLKLIPYKITNPSQLHYLFTYGWGIWLERRREIEEKNSMQFSLSGRKAYGIINNLIEKSIGNYIVETNWQKNKNVLDSE